MGLYTIGVVSRMLGIHQQTLRDYERRGLIQPSRSSGGSRLYSEEDVEEIRRILLLTGEMGVNLAGVEVILGMRKRIAELIQHRDHLQAMLLQALERLEEAQGQARRQTLVRIERGGLVRHR